jgi:hypothetical protein
MEVSEYVLMAISPQREREGLITKEVSEYVLMASSPRRER